MTEIEEKSVKAQLELYKEILAADRMIINCVQNAAATILDKILYPKNFEIEKDQKTVEFTLDEFIKMKQTIHSLSCNDGFKGLTSWINEQYLMPREEKLKILEMLQ